MKTKTNLFYSKILFGIILLFGIKSELRAQNYESIFGVNSTQWNIKMGNLWGEGTDEHNTLGDTTINAIQYMIIGGFSISGYEGYLREDINQGKAWYRNNQDTTEYLIMDLNLEIGDSMFIGGNWNPNPDYYKVDSIYEISNRKYLRFDFELFFMDGSKFTLIEGITSNLGFRYQDENYINNFNPELLCSYKDEIQEYGIGDCIYTGIDEVEEFSKIKIYPNPFKKEFTIDNKENSEVKIYYRVISSIGEILIRGELNSNEKVIEVLKDQNTGFYFIEFFDELRTKKSFSKIMKIDVVE